MDALVLGIGFLVGFDCGILAVFGIDFLRRWLDRRREARRRRAVLAVRNAGVLSVNETRELLNPITGLDYPTRTDDLRWRNS